MEQKRIVDYFAVCGVGDKETRKFYEPEKTKDPITDICVINCSDKEPIPGGYEIIAKTPNGHDANLNHGSYLCSNMYLCIRRGRDKPPLKTVGVYYEGSDKLDDGVHVIRRTPSDFDANVNNSQSKTFITYQSHNRVEPCNQLVVSEICVIISEKNEHPPHAYMIINKNLNKGLFGSTVYLCYKLTYYEPPYLRYDPVLLDRYPQEDQSRFPIPEFFPHFCLPRGAAIQAWPSTLISLTKPKALSFVLTSELADKLYVVSINFYDQISPLELTCEELKYFGYEPEDENINKKFFRSKAICFVSRWPFLDQFRDFGSFLVQTFSPSNLSSNQISTTSTLETYIYKFMEMIPFPKPDSPNIEVLIDKRIEQDGKRIEHVLTFSQTFDDLPFFSCGASFEKLLTNSSIENCLFILLFALTEQKILLHTLRPGILAEVAEAIISIIFPFNWHCPYIPLCPMNLYSVVHAPLPFIIGIDSGYFDHCEPPDDVAYIDLDTQSIYLSEKKTSLNLNILPKKELKQLKSKLEGLRKRYQNNSPTNPLYQHNRRKLDIECQEAFLYFMASLLRDFKSYLKPITAVPKVGATDPTSLFDMNQFLKSRESSSQHFYKCLLKTQMFTKFIEERCLVSDKNISLAFFDECVDKVERYEKGLLKNVPTLIEIDDQQKSYKSLTLSFEDMKLSLDSDEDNQVKQPKKLPVPGIGTLDHKQFLMFRDKHVSSMRKSFNSIATSSSGRASIDSSNIDSDLNIYSSVKRTKYENKKSSRIAKKVRDCPVEWAKYLLLTTYGLWFTHFPAFSHILRESNVDSLNLAFQVLKRMHSMRFSISEEFCYRILMVLCNVYNRPALAVKVLLHTKKIGVTMNAITYGYYNKTVLESNWSENSNRTTNDRWKLLRNVLSIVNYMSKKINKNHIINDSDSEKEAFYHSEENIDHENSFQNETSRDFSIKTIKDDNIEAHIVLHDSDSIKADSNSIKSEDSLNQISTRFTTPIKDAWTNMDIFSNKYKVGSTIRSSFRFAKIKLNHKKDSFTTPTKMNKSHTFDDGPREEYCASNESQAFGASLESTPNVEKTFPFNTATSQSPWTAKHSEYVLSTFKSAANRFNELKVQFASNSNNSPAKSQSLSSNLFAPFKNFYDKDDLGSNVDQISDSGITLSKPSDVLENLSMYRDLFDTASMFYFGPILDPPEIEPSTALLIEIISANICNSCENINYDEEIMSGWDPSDSDLKSKCFNSECGGSFVPNLTIYIKDYRKSDGSIDKNNFKIHDPISFAYLSPMVLRKELETILVAEGYSCLLHSKFVDEHPIIYWNLLWYFQRINLPTHISGLALDAKSLKLNNSSKSQIELNYLNVKVDCRWDYESIYKNESLIPRHIKWLKMKNGEIDNNFEEEVRLILDEIRQQNVYTAIQYLISSRVVSKSSSFPSIYRDLFFLTVIELDLPLDVFDKLYCDAFNILPEKERESLISVDSPPNVFTIFCRSLFKQLSLR